MATTDAQDPGAEVASGAEGAPDVEVELLEQVPGIGPAIARSLVPTLGARPKALPARRVMVTGLDQDADRLSAYSRVCGFTLRDTVPATWLHVLTFPLQVHLMAAGDFPLPLPGMVHVANRMELLRPVRLDEQLTLSSRAEDLRAHRSGTAVDLLGEARVGDEVVWTGRSTYLVRGKRPQQNLTEKPGSTDKTPLKMGGRPTALWRLPADLGRRYAAVSGDVNPIHLTALSAKALGFPRAIAHGMWTHARALAALERHLPAAYAVDVEFRKPLLLPSTAGFATAAEGEARTFRVSSADGAKDRLLGQITPVGPES